MNVWTVLKNFIKFYKNWSNFTKNKIRCLPMSSIKPRSFDSPSCSRPDIEEEVSIDRINSQSRRSTFIGLLVIGIPHNITRVLWIASSWWINTTTCASNTSIKVFQCEQQTRPSTIQPRDPNLPISARGPVEISHYPIHCKTVQCLKGSVGGFDHCSRR